MRRRWLINAFLAVAALGAPATARANGAFPDSESIITPADRPQDILLVTNFGLVTSSDDGKTWLWSCEQDGNSLGAFYQLTPLPQNRLFTVSTQKLAFSDDRSCGWQTAGGAVAGQSITDAYLDTVSGTRVFAIAVSNQVYSLYQSTDSGGTFAPALYQAPMSQIMSGVESARSDPNVVYLAMRSTAGAPLLARSSDGGAHFTVNDLSADLGSGLLRIIAVDPGDANRVLLSFLGSADQSIALTTDGGMSVTKPVTINGNFNSYTRLPSGTILIGAMVDFSSVPGLFRSHDGGASFEMVASPPGIRALSQRNGLVYAAADNFGDGYAIGTSADEGSTWQGLMTYADIKAINPCLKTTCQDVCSQEVGLSLWTADTCSADAPMSTGTAGSGGGGNVGMAGSGGATGGSSGVGGAGGSGGGGKPPSGHSGCAVAGRTAVDVTGACAMMSLLVLAARRRRRR
ncbi:MAG TPA: sialidase family protein [Polyangia bacterium]